MATSPSVSLADFGGRDVFSDIFRGLPVIFAYSEELKAGRVYCIRTHGGTTIYIKVTTVKLGSSLLDEDRWLVSAQKCMAPRKTDA